MAHQRKKKRMRQSEEELEATYRQFSNSAIASLAAEPETLTDTARKVLAAEIQRRDMRNGELEKEHKRDLHREARFDQLERMRRKNLLLYLLTRNDPKGTIAVFVLILVGIFVLWLRSLFH